MLSQHPHKRTHTNSFNAFRKAMLSQHHWKNNSNCKTKNWGMLSQQPKTHTCTQPQCVLTKNAVAATLKKNDWGMLSQHPHKHTHTHSSNAFRKAMLSQHHWKKQLRKRHEKLTKNMLQRFFEVPVQNTFIPYSLDFHPFHSFVFSAGPTTSISVENHVLGHKSWGAPFWNHQFMLDSILTFEFARCTDACAQLALFIIQWEDLLTLCPTSRFTLSELASLSDSDSCSGFSGETKNSTKSDVRHIFFSSS